MLMIVNALKTPIPSFGPRPPSRRVLAWAPMNHPRPPRGPAEVSPQKAQQDGDRRQPNLWTRCTDTDSKPRQRLQGTESHGWKPWREHRCEEVAGSRTWHAMLASDCRPMALAILGCIWGWLPCADMCSLQLPVQLTADHLCFKGTFQKKSLLSTSSANAATWDVHLFTWTAIADQSTRIKPPRGRFSPAPAGTK